MLKSAEPLSVVIRAWNEAAALELLLSQLRAQEYPQELVELIVVDNGSTDQTKQITARFGAKHLFLAQKDFSYPKSLNIGVNASTSSLILLISAHGLPMNTHWLRTAASYFDETSDPLLAGMYGVNVPGKSASVAEKLLMWPDYWRRCLQGIRHVKTVHPGIFNATNCAFRKKLFEIHPFDERFGAGGEDYEWAKWALEAGYYFILDPSFSVRHSHGLGFSMLLKQQQYWKKLTKQQAFSHQALEYRSDLKERIRTLE